MADRVGRLHAKQTRERFESAHDQGVAEKERAIRGAISAIVAAVGCDRKRMRLVYELFEDLDDGRCAEEAWVGLRVEEIVRG